LSGQHVVQGLAVMRSTKFGGPIARLLDADQQSAAFRIDDRTVAVAHGDLARRVLARRPIQDGERTVFKPANGCPVTEAAAASVMRALARDVRAAMAAHVPVRHEELHGVWPKVGFRHLRTMVFPDDPRGMLLLVTQFGERSVAAVRCMETLYLAFSSKTPRQAGTALAGLIDDAATAEERRTALVLYRRGASALCSTVATLLANALWLAAPLDPDIPARWVLLETLRLLPPAWMLFRRAGHDYADLHDAIRDTDDILVLPLLAHRRPDAWHNPGAFTLERWSGVADPDALTDFVPFGYGADRCPAHHLVLMLAERLFADMAGARLTIARHQSVAKVPMAPLLSVSRLHAVSASSPRPTLPILA
jgi:hypothetical protein